MELDLIFAQTERRQPLSTNRDVDGYTCMDTNRHVKKRGII